MLFLFRSAPVVEKRIHSKLFRKFWRSRGTKEPAYITVVIFIMDNISENWGWLESNSDEQLKLRPQCTTNLVLSKKRWISVVGVFGGLMTRTSMANAGAEDT